MTWLEEMSLPELCEALDRDRAEAESQRVWRADYLSEEEPLR